MNLKFSIHFQQKIIERGISIDHLKKVIKNSDEVYISFGNRTVARKVVDGRILEVVYVKGLKNEYRILTAYYVINE
jgi:hypothetical protein